MSLIQEIPLGGAFFRKRVEAFLRSNSLRMEAMDSYYAIMDADENILAGAGICDDVIKCVAVSEEARSQGLMLPLISHIVSLSSGRNLKVFTKPEYQAVFESLGFRQIAAAPKAVLMENGRGVEEYCASLKALRGDGRGCVMVMNANPLTLGHEDVVRRASALYDRVYVIAVKENVSVFSYEERLEMMRSVLSSEKVSVLEGSSYQISALTFPTYFLKDLSEASETEMRLDIDLFARWIAPALGVKVRLVGEEPVDSLTARYNELLAEMLPPYGLSLHVLPRYRFTPRPASSAPGARDYCPEGEPLSASLVRRALTDGRYTEAAAMVPARCRPYLLAHLATRALLRELELPLKPGLVCPYDSGAHIDMDHHLMVRSIETLHPYFVEMAAASSASELQRLGIEAEAAMMAATGGVNTHRGAIFALGLAVNAAMNADLPFGRGGQAADYQEVMQGALSKIAWGVLRNQLTENKLSPTAKTAREMAAGGYKELFDDWLPYCRDFSTRPSASVEMTAASAAPSASVEMTAASSAPSASVEMTRPSAPVKTWLTDEALQRTLLRIMSTLDDTCIIRRAGQERLQKVKQEALQTLSAPDFETALKELCSRYAAEGISPGGAADMLSLTIFIDYIV